MSTRKIIAFNTASQLTGKIIGAGTTFLVSLMVARQFGADGYGDFVKVTTYIAFFFLIADFGLNAVYLQKPKDLWKSLLGLRIVGSLALMFLSLVILTFLPQGTSQGYTPLVRFGIFLFAPTILFQAIITTSNAIFQRDLRYELATIAIAVGSVVTLAVLWFTREGILSLLAGSVASAVASVVLIRTHEPLGIIVSKKTFRLLLVPAVPLGLTLVFNLVYGHADSIILTLTRQTAEVGIYGLSYRVFEVALVLPTFFMNAVYPMLLKAPRSSFKKILGSSLLFLLSASLFLTICLWAGAPILAKVRQDFASSVPALRVLSLGLPFFFVSAMTMWALVALRKQWLLFALYGAGMVLNVALNIFLIPTYGYMAAAWVTVVSEAIVLVASGVILLQFL